MTLKLNNLSKRTGETWAMRNITLDVQNGEILGLFGTSENELLSFLQVIAGNESQDEGEVFFNNEDFSNSDKRNNEFYFPKSQSGSSIFGSVLKVKFVTNQKDKKFDFEKILLNAGKVVLLKNPFRLTKNKSLEQADSFREAVNKKGISVIISSENYEEIFAFCDQVAILHNGGIVQMGTPREVYEKPNSVIVAEITGRNNLIAARRISSTKKETPEFQTIEGKHRLFTDKVEKMNLGAINQNINLAIRPEHISISFGASFPADNLLKAQITDIKYLGATTLIKLDANGLLLEALVLRLVGLKVGDECVVGLPPERILVLKD